MTNMEENGKESKSKDILLMLSGGRDSFLSACRLIEDGFRIHMITFDNGCMSNSEDAGLTANRIIAKYGEASACYVGVYSIAALCSKLEDFHLYCSLEKLVQQYGSLPQIQLPCLDCHTAMYLAAIAYCKTHNIFYLAEGGRKAQKFFVELPDMRERYEKLAKEYDLILKFPVYELEDDWERKMELAERGFVPKVLEPQCWRGRPMHRDLTETEIKGLKDFYDYEIEDKLKPLIEKQIKKNQLQNQEKVERIYNEIS